jgi:uncharacterized protein (DUF2141 family)
MSFKASDCDRQAYERRSRRAGLVLLACAFFVVTLMSLRAQETAAFTVSGTQRNGSGQHTIHVVLWDSKGFLRKSVQEAFIMPGGDARYAFAVPPGRWAISAYEDRNENGKLDTGFRGPKEPTGFWRAFSRPPQAAF